MKKIIKITILSIFFILMSCETTELDLQDNPNTLGPENISLNDGLNGLLVDFGSFFEGTQFIGSQLTRMHYMFGSTYQNAMQPGTGGTAWNIAYADILLNSNVMFDKMIELNIDAPLHKGVMYAMRAYILMTLVDYWGDVPFSEALQGVDNFSPSADSGTDVYNAALNEMDMAMTHLTDALTKIDTDGNVINNIPGGSTVLNMFFENAADEDALTTSWIKFVNSLKFKYYLNLGNPTELNNLITNTQLIENNIDNVAFRYVGENSPESRHPNYDYDNPTAYMSNSYMYAIVSHTDNPNPDPRGAYYFYRQTTSFPSPTDNPSLGDALPCSNDASPYDAGVAFCSFGAGYWGRDHGDADGIPPDNDTRTAYGVYPIGGSFDQGDGGSVSDEDGMNGAGISPLLMSFQMDLMRAEAALTLGTIDDPATLLQAAMNKSITYVTAFDGSTPESPATYTANVMTNFNAADNNGKLQIIAEQMWVASFGSGTEIYNMYRRTGKPDNLQPHLLGTGAGNFPRTMFYPLNTANINLNISQKTNLDESVFWADGSIILY